MTQEQFQELTSNGLIFLDGATGSNLLAAGMPNRVCAEKWILENPEVLKDLQKRYVQAGSQIVYAPTFGANRHTLSGHHLEDRVRELNVSLVQISKDHSLVAELLDAGIITPEQALHHPQKNVITRALGSEQAVDADIFQINLSPGDTLLLCSDGLSNIVPEAEMSAVLLDSSDAQSACRDLLDLALSRGAPDNVTMIVWKR